MEQVRKELLLSESDILFSDESEEIRADISKDIFSEIFNIKTPLRTNPKDWILSPNPLVIKSKNGTVLTQIENSRLMAVKLRDCTLLVFSSTVRRKGYYPNGWIGVITGLRLMTEMSIFDKKNIKILHWSCPLYIPCVTETKFQASVKFEAVDIFDKMVRVASVIEKRKWDGCKR